MKIVERGLEKNDPQVVISSLQMLGCVLHWSELIV